MIPKGYINHFFHFNVNPWRSLVEVDEQSDRPKSQTSMERCHTCAA